MKKFTQNSTLVLSLEKDDEKNPTGMQLRIWTFNNGTTIVVRIFSHSKDAVKKLWGEKNNGQVGNFLLEFLQKMGLIKKTSNWTMGEPHHTDFAQQDEFEESKECIYFAWSVQRHLISKF